MPSDERFQLMNWDASPVDLYDMPGPGCGRHISVRNAIEKHRNGERAPVMLHE